MLLKGLSELDVFIIGLVYDKQTHGATKVASSDRRRQMLGAVFPR